VEERLLVAESAARELLKMLRDTSASITVSKVSADQLRTKLFDVCGGLWAKGRASLYGEGDGRFWVIDISQAFSNISLYAIARKVPHSDGNFAVMNVVDEDGLEELVKGNHFDGSEENVQLRERVARRPAKTSDGPVLLRWRLRSDESPSAWEEKTITKATVAAEVQALLAKGVNVDQVEIWTERKKPQVRVELV